MKAYGIFIGTGDELLRLRNLESLGLNGNRFNDSALSPSRVFHLSNPWI